MSRKHRIIRTNGQRIAFTNTSRIPDEEWIEAIKLVAKEIDLSRTIIHAKKHHFRSTWGLAYPSVPTEANMRGLEWDDWDYLITLTDHGYSKMDSNVVNTLGHEAKHIEQFRRGTLKREKKARNCEPQARAFGSWIADRWKESLC